MNNTSSSSKKQGLAKLLIVLLLLLLGTSLIFLVKWIQDDNPASSSIPVVFKSWNYEPKTIVAENGMNIASVAQSCFPPSVTEWEQKNIGGVKLIGEMSADKVGNKSSFTWSSGLCVLSLDMLKLEYVHGADNVVNRTIEGKIAIHDGSINYYDTNMGLVVQVENVSDVDVVVEIEDGQMVEVLANRVQNVVVNKSVRYTLRPKEKKEISVPVFCAAKNRWSPVWERARLTPFRLKLPKKENRTQQDVWNFIDEGGKYVVTFYAYGKGTQIGNGRSRSGHAFVHIPTVGLVGFGSEGGEFWGGPGRISNHDKILKYAQYECSVSISAEQLSDIAAKYVSLKDHTPNYNLGIYDCTSFVMDIADAGNIKYGPRVTIQTPVGFLQELKKHNR